MEAFKSQPPAAKRRRRLFTESFPRTASRNLKLRSILSRPFALRHLVTVLKERLIYSRDLDTIFFCYGLVRKYLRRM